MARAKKLTPIEAFQGNMADAEHLVRVAEILQNERVREVRTEMRGRLGEAFRIPKKRQNAIRMLQNEKVAIVFLPDSNYKAADLADTLPLLRQAIVAACAAVETYYYDLFMSRMPSVIRAAKSPSELHELIRHINVPFEDMLDINQSYKRTGWGVRELVLDRFAKEYCSTAPNKVGKVLSALGYKGALGAIDKKRGVKSGTSNDELERITVRRNQIAHQADRRGRGRAQISFKYVANELGVLREIVDATDTLVKGK